MPAVFSHFVTNLPAFHQVLVFVCVKAVPIPHVCPEERHLVGRIGPRDFHMFRCVVRYGYKDLLGEESDFENDLVLRIAEFVHMEAAEAADNRPSDGAASAVEGRMSVVRRPGDLARTGRLLVQEPADEESIVVRAATAATDGDKSDTLESLQAIYEAESPGAAYGGRRQRVRFELSDLAGEHVDPEVKAELAAIVEAKHAGVAYIMGHSYT